MIELANSTPKDFKGPISLLYRILFDPEKHLIALEGLTLIQGHGMLEKEDYRKLSIEYKNEHHNLEIFHDIRENGECIGIASSGKGNLIKERSGSQALWES